MVRALLYSSSREGLEISNYSDTNWKTPLRGLLRGLSYSTKRCCAGIKLSDEKLLWRTKEHRLRVEDLQKDSQHAGITTSIINNLNYLIAIAGKHRSVGGAGK